MGKKTKRKRMWILYILLFLVGLVGTIYVVYNSDIRKAFQLVEARSNLMETPHGNIEYAETGEGSPVLILHGAGGGYDQGLLIGQIFLGDNVRIIAPSRFGYLNSEQPQDYSLEAQTDALAALLDELGLERVAVMAISAGGPSGLYFSQRYPERTEALIMVCAISYTDSLIEEDIKKLNFIFRIFDNDFLYWVTLKAFRKPILDFMGVPGELLNNLSHNDQAFLDEILELMLPMSQRMPGIQIDVLRQIPGDFPYDQIAAPTLVLHAQDDAFVPLEQGINASTKIPEADMIIFEKGGHFLIGNMEELQKTIIEFLKAH